MIRIVEVLTKKQLTDFINFPNKLYEGNKYRVPQLITFEKSILDKKKNPAFEYIEARYWLAYQDEKIVGRIAGFISRKANEIWQQKTMRFGWIDFIEDFQVSDALLNTLEAYAREKGMNKIQGPMGFTDLDLEGMLVEGFEETGTQAVIYNYPYYPVHLEKKGYTKEVDWIQFEIEVPTEVPEKIKRVAEIVKKKYNLRILKVKKAKDLIPYAKSMFHTLNVSFANLYGFVPLSEQQITYYIKQYFDMIDKDYVCFVLDPDDKVVGFGIAFPSLSQAMIKAKGKLFPTGFIHILRAMYKNDKVDMLLQGVVPEYHNKGVPAIFFAEMMQAFINKGVKTAISSHALEHNTSAYLMFQDYKHRQHLRRRSYHKMLDTK